MVCGSLYQREKTKMRWYNYIGAGLLFLPLFAGAVYGMYYSGGTTSVVVFFTGLALVAYVLGSIHLMVKK